MDEKNLIKSTLYIHTDVGFILIYSIGYGTFYYSVMNTVSLWAKVV